MPMSLAPAYQQQVQALYLRHHGWLHGWLRRRLGDGDAAADLAHDTFVRLLGRPHALHALREPRAYLGAIAHGLAASHLRRRALEAAWLHTLAALPEAHAPSPERRAITLQTLHQLDEALHTLPARVRQAFLMAQFDGMKQRDIAAALGLSVPTVKKYMQRAWLACLHLMPED
ncbi:sigma-70 family RNA polymerase sigma factor [Vandammella animalimorsus]|uniref:Sigma-70 family RNA polymerase sigma factor n=2 Tax=Vandammella animalimorsus TaxID=2029117 RepID=A0A3M6RJ80_9BURK|nr:sigma-70 family RNA polymerase sigma factor [Vandammella animalimorsus]RMX15223.1 sigma-70 family RNA polymerase sigma factor [Vandammella animalimorsus]